MRTIFTRPEHYNQSNRSQLIDLLKPFLGKSQGFSDLDRKTMYGISEQDLRITDKIQEADFVVLPMAWNYYYTENNLHLALGLVHQAKTFGKKVLSWTSGDFGVVIPHFDNLVVLRQSGYRSKLPSYHQGMPVFFKDPLTTIYNRKEIFLREKSEKPIIGFCGQAAGSWKKYFQDTIRTGYRNTKYWWGHSPEEPQDLFPSTLRRQKILNKIEKDNRVQANFIKRQKYRAGAKNPEQLHQSTLEFFDNMVHSDYIVCVRGGGNFSVRLYETLAMGRIPVFVNTDCLLPFENSINWKKHMVWVEKKEMNKVCEIIHDFHSKISSTEYTGILEENRKLWENSLTSGRFFNAQIENLF